MEVPSRIPRCVVLRSGAVEGDPMTYDELVDFIHNLMTMSHEMGYQEEQ